MAGKEKNEYAEILLSCIEEKYFKDEIAMEHHSFARIISGEMKVVQADHSYLFGPGETLFFPCNQLSTLIKNPKNGLPYKAIVIFFRPERLKEYYATNPPLFTNFNNHQVRSYDKHPMLESFFASLIPYFDLKSKLPEKIISIKIQEAIAILRTVDPSMDNLLADFSQLEKINLLEFMERNYMFNMNVEKFGRMTGRSLTTFKRDFKKTFNTTPQKWLIQKRLELAHHKLSKDGRKPIDVYLEIGFENLSHFSYAFKKYFGYPPTVLVNSSETKRVGISHQ